MESKIGSGHTFFEQRVALPSLTFISSYTKTSYCDVNMLYHDIIIISWQYTSIWSCHFNTIGKVMVNHLILLLSSCIQTSFYYIKEHYLDIIIPYHHVNVSCPHIILSWYYPDIERSYPDDKLSINLMSYSDVKSSCYNTITLLRNIYILILKM